LISIIIPTCNRSATLLKTLHGYLKQTSLSLIKELVIVDDGSTDDTGLIVKRVNEKSPIKIIYLYQDNKGPAEARNKGIRLASGELILMTGDDIVPNPDMIKEHFLKHKSYNLDKNIAVLGHTAWPENVKVTPFMKHIQENGLQFGYSIIPDENDVPFNFFYTSNISLHRGFLLGDKLFDTDFPFAAWEDIELAYRLKKRGLKIIYNKSALGFHHHRISYASFRDRQEKSGHSARIFHGKHPELSNILGIEEAKNQSPLLKWAANIADIYCLIADKYHIKIHPVFYNTALGKYYRKGLANKYNKIVNERTKKI